MKRISVVLAAVFAAGCLHTQTVGEKNVEAEEDGKTKPVDKTKGVAMKPKPKPNTDPNLRTEAKDVAKPQDVKPGAYEGRPELSPSPEGIMKPDAPSKIQIKLSVEGYYQGPLTGRYDDKTMTAMRALQKKHELSQTGMPDRESLSKLGLSMDEIFREPPSKGDAKQQFEKQDPAKKQKEGIEAEKKPVPQT